MSIKFEIINVEFLGEDGKTVFASFNTGETAILDSDNPKVQEYLKNEMVHDNSDHIDSGVRMAYNS